MCIMLQTALEIASKLRTLRESKQELTMKPNKETNEREKNPKKTGVCRGMMSDSGDWL